MATSILGVGQSALAAAQAGLITTGHNIANASTPGYSRQIVVQSSAGGQDLGFGYVGKGTQVTDIRRVFNEFLNNQVVAAQSSSSELDSYYTQISQINNLFADSSAGLSPALQDFFSGVQDLASIPVKPAARQSALSAAETLAGRFQSLDGQLRSMAEGVNSEINSSISTINNYAEQIAKLNDAIEKAQGSADGRAPNDLLDQRDLAVSELSKQIKTTVVKQGNSYNVSIGNGQPLVVGSKPFDLEATVSPTDPGRIEVGYMSNGQLVRLSEDSLTGGKLGGLFSFRSQTLDVAQNALGRVAIGLASAFNAQHQLGMDQNGNVGGAFFNVASPLVRADAGNTASPAAVVGASITDASSLTTSDYMLQTVTAASAGPPPVAGAYKITRLSDGAVTNFSSFPQTVDGVEFNLTSGNPAAGDSFLVRPTVNGAADFSVAIKDVAKIAAAVPIRTEAPTTNTGTGAISAGTVSSTAVIPPVSLTFTAGPPATLSGFPSQLPVTVKSGATTTTYPAGTPVPYAAGDVVTFGGVQVSGIPAANGTYSVGIPQSTLTYDGATGTLSGFPSYLDVSVKHSDGTVNSYAAGTPVPYADGDTVSFGGVSFTLTGTPDNNDKFTVGPNTNGVGDNRNAVLLGALQNANTLGNSNGTNTTTFQGAYAQLVSLVGNKTHELDVTGKAQKQLLTQAVAAQQAESGVNLDEEATNLMRYQQAYQAAGKVMQTASQLFELLLSLGGQ